MFFRLFCVAILTFCCTIKVTGCLTARNHNGKIATMYDNEYGYRDSIFVFNKPKKGNLNLLLQTSETYTFKWYRFDYETQIFDEMPDVTETSLNDMDEGGYKVTVTFSGDEEKEPRDSSFVAWLYINPEFDFKLLKDDNGELLFNYKNCFFTDFRLSPNTVQSSFQYYSQGRLATLENRISYSMKRGNESAIVTSLNIQGNTQYFREYNPPYEDTQYYFTASDMFGVERKDEIMYRTIIPYITIDQPILPEIDPASAPVPVKFTSKPYNVSEWIWRFGDGDSAVYNLEYLPPDTVFHTYYTPKKQGYNVTLKVTSLDGCTFVFPTDDITLSPVTVSVDDPLLDVANVFTPNNDGENDYFKPFTVSLRGFEIMIYTRNGKRVYYYKGDDLREWEGWDGRMENSGKEAPVGVYFYTIKALGWDNPPTRNPMSGPYSGSFHLYR